MMIRILPTLAVATAVALPFAAMGQTSSQSCGPETWSTEKMMYVKTPCDTGPGAQTAQASSPTCGPETWSTDKMQYVSKPCTPPGSTVGAAGPTAAANSTTMTKAEMKQGGAYAYGAPMPAQAAAPGAYASGPYASSGDCGPATAAAITDEYGRKYNCRGDRIR